MGERWQDIHCDPSDLSVATLLHHDRQLWRPWLRAAGLESPEPSGGAVFSDTGLLLDAAVAGEGVALARGRLAAGDIAQGRLVRLFAIEVPDRNAYHLVRPIDPMSRAQDSVDCFALWLKRELAKAEGTSSNFK